MSKKSDEQGKCRAKKVTSKKSNEQEKCRVKELASRENSGARMIGFK